MSEKAPAVAERGDVASKWETFSAERDAQVESPSKTGQFCAQRKVHKDMESGVDELDWPAHSPDLNPIGMNQHLWDELERRLRARPSHPTSQLKQQRDKLRRYQQKLVLQLEKERLLAKQLLKNGKRETALLLLKKRHYQDQLLDKTETQISNLERMVQDLEYTQIEVKVLEGLKVGNDCLKKMHEAVSIEAVERIMEETQEAIEYQKQIDEMLAGSLSPEDEEVVLAELEAIIQAEDVPLPEVPADSLPGALQPEKERKPAKVKTDPEMLAA